jgi:ABC-type phosphonate transport system ATPase subunit
LDDDVDEASDIRERIGAAEADAGLHHHQRQLLERPGWGVGMNSGEGAGMARVDGAKKGDRFRAAHFSQDDAIRAKAKRCLKEVISSDASLTFVAFHGD